MIWVWMGAEENADPETILRFKAVVASERVTSVRGYLNIKAAEPLISDNLLDLSHAEFLHPYLANPGFNERLEQSVKHSWLSVADSRATNGSLDVNTQARPNVRAAYSLPR